MVVLGVIQFGSDALSASAAQPGSLPTRIPLAFGLSVYRGLDRIAPLPFVESTLAHYQLRRGNLAAAQHDALALPADEERNEFLAQIALARGQHRLAYEYFFAALDIVAVQREVHELALHDPVHAYADEVHFKNHLIALTTHPDAVAQADWMLGEILTKESARARTAALRTAALQQGLLEYRKALALAPMNMPYVLAAANQALKLHDVRGAHRLFEQGMNFNPASADALAGLGIIALRDGNRWRAQSYATRAHAIDPKASELLELERLLR